MGTDDTAGVAVDAGVDVGVEMGGSRSAATLLDPEPLSEDDEVKGHIPLLH